MFVIVTVTPGSAAPLLSLTVPSMLPLIACDCARAGSAVPITSSAATTRVDHDRVIDDDLLSLRVRESEGRALGE